MYFVVVYVELVEASNIKYHLHFVVVKVSCTCTYVLMHRTRKLHVWSVAICFKFPVFVFFHSWPRDLAGVLIEVRLLCIAPLSFNLDLLSLLVGLRSALASWWALQLQLRLSLSGCCLCDVVQLVMDMDIPLEEVRFTVVFRTGDQGHGVNRVLTHFGLGELDCDINQVMFPVTWPVGRPYDPPLPELTQHWIPWDEDLSPTAEVHLYVAHLPLYQELASLADVLQGHIQMVSFDTPPEDRSQTVVVIHQVPMILMMELVPQLVQRVRTLECRIVDAEAVIQHLRQDLGI